MGGTQKIIAGAFRALFSKSSLSLPGDYCAFSEAYLPYIVVSHRNRISSRTQHLALMLQHDPTTCEPIISLHRQESEVALASYLPFFLPSFLLHMYIKGKLTTQRGLRLAFLIYTRTQNSPLVNLHSHIFSHRNRMQDMFYSN